MWSATSNMVNLWERAMTKSDERCLEAAQEMASQDPMLAARHMESGGLLLMVLLAGLDHAIGNGNFSDEEDETEGEPA